MSSNPVEGRTKICQLKDLILTLFGLIFRRIYIYILYILFEVGCVPSIDFGVIAVAGFAAITRKQVFNDPSGMHSR